MIERILPADPNPGAGRVSNEPEDVGQLALLVGVRDRLQSRCRRSEDQIKSAAGDLASDQVQVGYLCFGVVTLDGDVFSVDESSFRESINHAVDALVNRRLGGVLQQCNAGRTKKPRLTAIHVGKQ